MDGHPIRRTLPYADQSLATADSYDAAVFAVDERLCLLRWSAAQGRDRLLEVKRRDSRELYLLLWREMLSHAAPELLVYLLLQRITIVSIALIRYNTRWAVTVAFTAPSLYARVLPHFGIWVRICYAVTDGAYRVSRI